MRYWVFAIGDEAGGPDLGLGWIRAETPERALAMVPHANASVYEIPDDSGFPPEAAGPVHWDRRAPALMN